MRAWTVFIMSIICPQHGGECLLYSRYSINTCWMNAPLGHLLQVQLCWVRSVYPEVLAGFEPLYLCFLTYKMGIFTVPASEGCSWIK